MHGCCSTLTKASSPLADAEHYADELEEELDDALLQDFNVEAEDKSPAEVRW